MRSSDYGVTWTEVTTNLPAAASPPIGPVSLNFGKITDFSLDNTNPEIGYVAIGTFGGYPLNGVYRVGGTGAGVSTGAPASMVYESRLGGTSTTLPGNSNPIGSIRVTPHIRGEDGRFAPVGTSLHPRSTLVGTSGF